MRRGPYYNQWVDKDDDGRVKLKLPMEIEHDWEEMRSVEWKDNGDGSYMLVPSKHT